MSDRPQRVTPPPVSPDDDPPVADVMTRQLVGITSDTTVLMALQLMVHTGVRHLPVMDGQRCLGLVVEVDLVRCVAQGGSLMAGWSQVVGEIARPAEELPVAVRRSDAARRMLTSGSDAVVVVENGRVLGIVTTSDLIRSLAAAPRPPASVAGGSPALR